MNESIKPSSVERQKRPFKDKEQSTKFADSKTSSATNLPSVSVGETPEMSLSSATAQAKERIRLGDNSGRELALPRPAMTMLSLLLLGIWAVVLKLACCPDSLQYIAALPFIAFWSYWLFCIDYACGLRHNCLPPVKAWTLVLISVCNFILLPLSGGFNFQPVFDPFFYIWLLTLAYIPFRIGTFLEQKDNSDKRTLAYVFAACSIGLPLLVVCLPGVNSVGPELALAWLLSQFSWISYVVNKLSGEFDVSAKPKQVKRTQAHAGTNIVLRYRAFPQVERWFAQKFNSDRMLKGRSALLMWFGGPPLILVSIIGLSSFLPSLTPVSSAVTAIGAGASGTGYVPSDLPLFYGFFPAAIVALLPVLLRPTHLSLGEKGVGFLWRRKFFKFDGKPVAWTALSNIYIERPAHQSSLVFDKLCFQDNHNKVLRVKLNSLDSFEDKEILLNAITTWAPKVRKDASVIESLQPPSGYSYTELWLQALTAPPKRDRFKPLVHDALLKNNRYRILGSLGSGGQGFAYLAEDCSVQAEVVLKEFILPVYVDVRVRKSALEQFENEARILSRLQHPQIVHLRDYFVEDHRAYLVLEHIEGASLQEIVQHKGPIKQKEVLALTLQMCDILSYLHSQTPPVVHRDFTPDNLLLSTDGILKLIDFNVAESSESSTTTGTVVGKPAYLPPEQFRGVPTSQSDIYAMGATLYFLLTGKEPEPISVSHPIEANAEIDFALNEIIVKATQLEISNRYANIAELKQALQQIQRL